MQLQEALRRILSPHPAHADIEPFVSAAVHIATVYLHKRAYSGSLHPDFFGITIDDLAIDCVGPLFERDQDGRFPQLHAYYEPLLWTVLSEAELLACTRRLVFSKVHQQLAHLYKETDPSLEKILRNLRNAIRVTPSLAEERRGGELWVQAVSETDRTRRLPEMPWEYLEGQLIAQLPRTVTVRDVAARVAEVFNDQEIYRRGFPLTMLALLIRTAFSRMGGDIPPEGPECHGHLRMGEIRTAIGESVRSVSEAKYETYVAKGKVSADVYRAYVATVAAILLGEFVENDGNPGAYIRHLIREMPCVDAQQYQHYHRCHLEYLVKLARKELLERMKGEF